jgi:arylsulfatase A-like enzyme
MTRCLGLGAGMASVFTLSFCGGSSTDTSDLDAGVVIPPPPPPDASQTSKPPNIVFVLTDDLSWNLVKYMPHVQEMQAQGMTFTKYFVTDSLCCPSRSSIFTGKYPHDTKVFTNQAPNGGYAMFESAGNAQATFATTLSGVGYKTAMMGKFLNGYSTTANNADPGWGEWDVADNGYPEFGYNLNQNGTVVSYGGADSDYLVDVLSGLGQKFIQSAGDSPFVIELATFAPHMPYTPAPRYVGTLNVKIPRTPAFNTANMNPPLWLEEHPELTQTEIDTMDAGFNLRAEAVRGVDDMIGAIRAELAASGQDKNTYIVFSSDNGYHMGDHRLLAGKETIFDTDINVPLIVVGPGVPAGSVSRKIVENIDLCPTFAEIAGTSPPTNADGRSLLPLLHGQTVTDWRNLALVEHVGPDVSPMPTDDPDAEPVKGPPPNSYEAIRMENAVYAEYVDGETEYYDLTTDPYELDNTGMSLTAAQVKKFHATIQAVKNCHDSASCWAAQKL